MTAAEDVDALHAFDRRKLRLQPAREPVGDLRQRLLGRREADIERRVRPIGAQHFDGGRFGFRRQLRSDLLQACVDLRERCRPIVIQLQAHRDRADAGAAARLDVIDAADGRHRAFDRRGQESAHGLGARAGVHGGDHDRGAFDVRILLQRQARERAPADQHQHEIDDDGEDGTGDEDVGERAHDRPPAAPRREPRPAFFSVLQLAFCCRYFRARVSAMDTDAASRSLNEPEATTCSPCSSPA